MKTGMSLQTNLRDGTLDKVIAAVGIETLGEILETYFVSIQYQPIVNFSSQLKWQTAFQFQFVQDTVLRLSKSNMKTNEQDTAIPSISKHPLSTST